MASDEDVLLDSLIQRKTNRAGADVHATVSDWFKSTFKSDLPVKNIGASDFEKRAGWEHSRSFDVEIHPSSDQGRQLIAYLTQQGIPYSAFTGAVSKGGRTVATGPHIHVGPPSHRIGTPTADDSLLDSIIAGKSQPKGRGGYGDAASAARKSNTDSLLDKLARDIEWHFGYSVLAAMSSLPEEKQREIATLATKFAAEDEVKKQQGTVLTRSPAWQLVNQNRVGIREGKEIFVRQPPEIAAEQQRQWAASSNPLLQMSSPVRLIMETLAQGGAGLLEAGAGGLRTGGLSTFPVVRRLQEKVAAPMERLAAETRQTVARADELAPHGTVAKLTRDVGGGAIEFAPLMAIPEAGIENVFARIASAAATGGAYTGTQAVGRGESSKEVAKAAGTGAAQFGLFGVPLPGKNVLSKALSNVIITGGGTTVINRLTGQPWSEAATQGLVMTLMRSPELLKGVKVREGGKERAATASDVQHIIPDLTEEIRLRQERDAKFNKTPAESEKVAPTPRTDDALLDSLIQKKTTQPTERVSAPAPNVEGVATETAAPSTSPEAVLKAAKVAETKAKFGETAAEVSPAVEPQKSVELNGKTYTRDESGNWIREDGRRVAGLTAEKLDRLASESEPVARTPDTVRLPEPPNVIDAEVRARLAQQRGVVDEAAQLKAAAEAFNNRVRLPPPPIGTRAFPESAVRAGLPEARNLTYAISTDEGAVLRANERIQSKGADRVAVEIFANKEPSKDDIVAGSIIAHQRQAVGDVEGAIDIIDHLAEKLTKGGQQSQAASLIARLSPEGVLLAAQRKLPSGMKLTVEQGNQFIDLQQRVVAAEAKVVTLSDQLAKMKVADKEGRPTTKRSTAEKIGTLQDRLLRMEEEARARLKSRVGVSGSQAGASTIPLDIADYAIIGASKLARKGMNKVLWADEMVKEFGDVIKPHLDRIFVASYKLKEEQRAAFLRERLERGAKKAGAVTEADINRVINERLDAQTEARKARVELQRTFDDLNATGGLRRFARAAGDIASLSRAIETTGDLSWGFRQGKFAFARHPRIWFEGFRKQSVALNKTAYERLLSEIELDPDYKYMRRGGLELQGVDSANSERLALRGEEFASHLVRKLPILKQSEMAYNAMGDWVKSRWFKARLEALRRAGVDLEAPESRQLLQMEGNLINNATGRGNLPFHLNQASPLINQLTFSARFWASRLKMLTLPFDPRMYGVSLGEGRPALPRATRVEAWKTLGAYYGVVGGQLLLLKAMGAKVGTDPNDPDFLKAQIGKIHVDFSAGMLKHLRFIARVTRAVAAEKNGAKLDDYQTPASITGQYLRGAESPNLGMVHDIFLSKKTKEGYGTDFKGDPVYPFGNPKAKGFDRATSSYLLQKHTPIVLGDVLQAYKEMGWKEAALLAPLSVAGESVSVYEPKRKKK